MHWVSDMAQPPFAAAANTPVLHAAFDLLAPTGTSPICGPGTGRC